MDFISFASSTQLKLLFDNIYAMTMDYFGAHQLLSFKTGHSAFGIVWCRKKNFAADFGAEKEKGQEGLRRKNK